MNAEDARNAAGLLQTARDCLAAERPSDAAGREAHYAEFSRSIRALYDLDVIGIGPNAEADENFDNVSKWFGRAFAPVDHPWRSESRAALGALFDKIERRIQVHEERHDLGR